MTAFVARIGRIVSSTSEEMGRIAAFAGHVLAVTLRPPLRFREFVDELFRIGVLSVLIITVSGLAVGMVLGLQGYTTLVRFGAENSLGAVVGLSLIRELGPVLAATMLAGRVGSAMAAELGTMRVTEQIDALECMGANPIYYLVVPRFLGCLVLIPALTVMADFMGVLGGYLYSHLLLGIDYHHYWNNSREYVDAFDFLMGIFKSLFFGAAIALVSCHHGFHSEPGAEGVGRAATNAFVHSFVLILVLDLFLGIWFNNIHHFFRPEGPRRLL